MSQQIPRLIFTKNWEDPADYATQETSEIQNRKDIQSLYTEIQSYLNHVLLPVLEAGDWGGGGSGGGSGSGNGAASGAYLPLSGGTMQGPLRLFRRVPQFTDEAASRAYVDDAAGRVQANVDGDLSVLRQDAAVIESLVQRNQGDITVLQQTAQSLTAAAQDALGAEAVLELMAGQISMEVSRMTEDGRVYAGITLKVGDTPAAAGTILLDGDVDVSGELSAEALYAATGEVADLAVDKLSTSRRVAKYLAGDTSDDNFIVCQDQYLNFVTGQCTGERQQAAKPDGTPLYWPVDVSGMALGADGYPRNNQNERIFTTTTPTAYPVYVYGYTEAVKRSIRFEMGANGVYEPVDVYGAGNAAGYNFARVKKGTEGFELQYTTPEGTLCGISMDTSGYLDLYGVRKTAALDFSQFDNGVFTETLDGVSAPQQYRVEFDENDRPVKITDGGGHETVIAW